MNLIYPFGLSPMVGLPRSESTSTGTKRPGERMDGLAVGADLEHSHVHALCQRSLESGRSGRNRPRQLLEVLQQLSGPVDSVDQSAQLADRRAQQATRCISREGNDEPAHGQQVGSAPPAQKEKYCQPEKPSDSRCVHSATRPQTRSSHKTQGPCRVRYPTTNLWLHHAPTPAPTRSYHSHSAHSLAP